VEPATRALVAYVAGLLITGRQCFAIQDHDRKRRLWMNGTVETTDGTEKTEIKVYSHERNNHVSGLGDGERYALYLHGGEGHLTLIVNPEEQRFLGCEHSSSFHYYGNIAGASVILFDYQDCHWHRFTLK
jgi:hypothetical protein